MTVRPRHAARLVRALLACLAVAIVVAPVVGTGGWREAIVVAPAGGSSPENEQRATTIAARLHDRGPTFRVSLQRTRLDYESPRPARELWLLTRVLRC